MVGNVAFVVGVVEKFPGRAPLLKILGRHHYPVVTCCGQEINALKEEKQNVVVQRIVQVKEATGRG